MGAGLKDVSKDALNELAVVLCLSSQDLQKANHGDKVRPSSSWAANQKAKVTRLPSCLLRRPPCGVVDQLSQMTKRVAMAASGGAEHVANRDASRSKSLDDRLHPFATATLLCRAHGKLRPALMREIFYYLSREVADCADPIRRHPRHDDAADRGDDSDSSDNSDSSDSSDLDPEHGVCKEKNVRDWGHRMLGLSAMWCDSQTFRALELGFSSASARRCHKTRDGRRRHGIPSVDRMPRLEEPCEACFLAAIGSRSQALVDLRAGLLSRIAHTAKEKERRHRDKKGKRRAHGTDPARPAHMPHLWKVVEAYVDAFDAPTAAAIRHNSELLADDLYIVRECEARRRRRQERKRKQGKHSGRHGRRQHRRREPPRMATKHGLRQPLPLLPDSLDPWATDETGQTADATSQTGHDQPRRPRRRHRTHGTHEAEASRRHHEDQGDGGYGYDRELSTYADPADGMYYVPDGMTGAEAMEAAAGATTPLPVWEGDYRHAIFSGASTAYVQPEQSSYGAAYGGASAAFPGHAQTSFVTVSMRTPTVTPTLRRRTSRIPVRNFSVAVPETVLEPVPEPAPVRSYGATTSRLSRPASHIPIPRSAASSSSTRTPSNGVRASPQSTARTATRAQSTARSTSPSTASPPNKPRRKQQSRLPSAAPTRPDNERRPRPRTPTTSSPSSRARTHPTRRSPSINVTSYIAAQVQGAAAAEEIPSRPPTAWPVAPVASSFYSGDNSPPWWEMQRASSVAPDDSISCVLGRRDTQAELAAVRRERQELLRQELQRQERQRARALAHLTGAYGSSGSGSGDGRRSEQSSLPSYLGCMAPAPAPAPAPASAPSMVPPPLQVRRLPPPQPRPPHQQPQTLRLSPWTRLQVQMHCRPLPPQPCRGARSTATTQWPDVRL